MGEEIVKLPLFILADDGQGELNELGPGLSGGALGRRDVVEILLAVHKCEMELPELLWRNSDNLIEEWYSILLDLIQAKTKVCRNLQPMRFRERGSSCCATAEPVAG